MSTIKNNQFDEFCEYVSTSAGHHLARLKAAEVVPEQEIAEGLLSKAHILLTWASKAGESFDSKVYSRGVPYFMDAIARQTHGATSGLRLSAVLDYIKTHDVELWVVYDSRYGMQVRFADPEASGT